MARIKVIYIIYKNINPDQHIITNSENKFITNKVVNRSLHNKKILDIKVNSNQSLRYVRASVLENDTPTFTISFFCENIVYKIILHKLNLVPHSLF